MSRKLSIACNPYDRVRPLIDRTVGVAGYELDFQPLATAQIHKACFEDASLEIGEVSPANLAVALDQGNTAYAGLPIFLSRAFRHGSVFVAADSKVKAPADLAEGRIGINDWLGTTSIWQRGILQDEYGLDLGKVTWFFAPIDAGGPYKAPSKAVAEKYRIRDEGAGRDLSDMLLGGEIDAILALRPPKKFTVGGPITRLFPNYFDDERQYYQRTGLFPVLHIVVLQSALGEADAALPRALFDAFSEAKTIAVNQLREQAFYFSTLPWVTHSVETVSAIMGEDYWQYGTEAGLKPIEAFLRYCDEQKVTSRRISYNEFFPFNT